MASVTEANRIDADLGDQWLQADALMRRAQLVLDWAGVNNIPTTVTPDMLAAAMGKVPYWCQGPANYLDMLLALRAALAFQTGT